jgi:hypothetical protein
MSAFHPLRTTVVSQGRERSLVAKDTNRETIDKVDVQPLRGVRPSSILVQERKPIARVTKCRRSGCPHHLEERQAIRGR